MTLMQVAELEERASAQAAELTALSTQVAELTTEVKQGLTVTAPAPDMGSTGTGGVCCSPQVATCCSATA